jgi:GT2 family glycosyltransferase
VTPARTAAIVVDYRSPDLFACLASLPHALAEVHVVDNGGSTDWESCRTLLGGRLREHQYRSNAGFGAGVNRAARTTQQEFIMCLNPDAQVVDWNWSRFGQIFAREQVALAAPNIVDAQGRAEPSAGVLPNFGSFVRKLTGRSRDTKVGKLLPLDDDWRVGWVSGAAFVARAAAFAAVGGFDDRYCQHMTMGTPVASWRRRVYIYTGAVRFLLHSARADWQSTHSRAHP